METENLYHLHVEPFVTTNSEEDLTRPLHMRVHLQRGERTWTDDSHVLAVEQAIVARCGELQRHPDDAPDVETIPGDVGATRIQRDPNPNLVVTDVHAAAIDDIGAWLWQQLPACVRGELSTAFANPVRLLVHAPGDASVLPWHRLAAGGRGPLATGQWDIALRVDGDTVGAPVAVRPRVLLLVGSQKQRPEADAPEHKVIDVVRAIRAAGWRCDVAAGRPRIATFAEDEGAWCTLDDPDQVRSVLARCRPDVVHFMGHSDATDRPDASPLGASALLIEVGPQREPRRLRIEVLADALREAGTRMVVLHACSTRERVAGALLGPTSASTVGAVDAVLAMGGMASPAVCADFSAAFYSAFGPEPRGQARPLSAAALAGRVTLRAKHPGLDWLPMVWTRRDDSLRAADAATERVERYCDKLVERLDAFEGLFEELHGAMEHVAIDLLVHWAREAGDDKKAHRYQRILEDLPAGERLHFARLLDSTPAGRGGWWTLGGEPGSGKTTTLRQHARALAKDRRRGHVPVYLPLASWFDRMARDGQLPGGGLARWIGHEVECDYEVAGLGDDLVRLARDGKLVLLFDGLDELTPAQRGAFTGKNTKSVLAELHAEMATSRVVVATRRYQSAKRLDPAWFDDADVCPLALEDAQKLLGNILRLRLDTQAAVDAHVSELGRRVDEGQRLWQDVAKTPLLVSLLALLLSRDGAWPASKMGFYTQSFDLLCKGEHKKRPRPLPALDDALLLLRHLAGQMTIAKLRVASRAQVEAWLAPPQAPPAVQEALADTARWLDPSERLGLDRPTNAAQAFLRRVAMDTLLFAPEDESPQAKWRFWHRSFQEALCARWLHEMYIAPAANESHGVEAVLAALDSWIGRQGGREPDAELVRRHRADLASVWQEADRDDDVVTLEQRDIISEAWSSPTDDPVARNVRLSSAQREWQRYAPVVLDEAARGRALREAQEPFTEALALLGEGLASASVLVEGLLRRNWQLALRVALAGARIDAPSVGPLLAALPELGQRVAVLEQVASVAHDPNGMLAAVQARAEQILAAWRHRPRRGVLTNGNAWKRHVWDTPGELRVLLDASQRIVAAGTDAWANERATEVRATIFAALPSPRPRELGRHLHLVPRREQEREPGRSEKGIRLWRFVPAGEFDMGSPDGGPRGDEVLHPVRIAHPFWISAVPVTVGLYRLFSPAHEVWIGDEGYRRVDADGLDPTTAVSAVSHHAARMFCTWLQHHAGPELLRIVQAQAREAGIAVPADIEVRLPWEAEWEYAARGRTTRGSTTRYFFGDDPTGEELQHWAWFRQGSGAGARPVATKRGPPGVVAGGPAEGANAFGLFDVHGNVWEWCEDWYAERYPVPTDGVREDVRGPASGRFRVLRGGSVWDDADYCRAAARDWFEPDGDGNNYGFRVVLAAVPRSVIDG